MIAKDKLEQLLEDEMFQDDVRYFDSFSKEKQKVVFEKYSITKEEVSYARLLFLGISFKNAALGSAEIDYALKKLKRRIIA